MKKLFCCLVVLFAVLAQAQIPQSNHVVVLLEENQSYPAVIGSPSMPFLNSLATQYGLATQYYANVHPSIGNYFMLTAGKTWKSYAEGLPSVGYTGGDVYPYIRHHNPLSYFSDVVNSSVQRLNLVPFSHFASDLANNALPNYSFVVPNQNHNAHDCPTGPTGCTNAQKLATADAWLKTNIAPLLSNPSFQQDGILIIVFDEGFSTDTAHGGGHVAAVVVGPKVKQGFKSATFYQHQNTLRTTMDALGVHTYPGAAGSAIDMSDLFTSSSSCTAAVDTVKVCAPAAGSTASSPVHFVAAAASTHPITAMRIYIDNQSRYSVNASSVNTFVSVSSGGHSVVVQAWDSAGAVFKSGLTITVP